MLDESNSPVPVNYFLKPGYIFVASKPTVVSTVLGSCVTVYVYDTKRCVGGVNHFQLPYVHERYRCTARYGNVATIALIRMMVNNGSKVKHLEAQVFGGAYNSEVCVKNVGHENVKVARKILARLRIRIVSEDVAGEKGRKVVFNTDTNEIAALKVDKLRKSDWYPYKSDR